MIPDIILRIDSVDVFDIELKQYNSPFNESFEKQLISYLNQTHLQAGMIVCKNIYLYTYDYNANKTSKTVIPFEKDNKDGIKLVELLYKDTFSLDNINVFVDNKHKKNNHIKEIIEQLNDKLVIDLLKTHFLEKYNDEEISEALAKFNVNIFEKNQHVSSIENNRQDLTYDQEESSTNNENNKICLKGCKQIFSDAPGDIIYWVMDSNNQKKTQSIMDIVKRNDNSYKIWSSIKLLKYGLEPTKISQNKNEKRPFIYDNVKLNKVNEIMESYGFNKILPINRHNFKEIEFKSSLTNKTYISKRGLDGNLAMYDRDSGEEIPKYSNPSQRLILMQAVIDYGGEVSNDDSYTLQHKLEKLILK